MIRKLMFMLAFSVFLIACVDQSTKEQVFPAGEIANTRIKAAKRGKSPISPKTVKPAFANLKPYSEPKFIVNAPKYSIAPNFKNVINANRFNLPESTKKMLLQNGFVIYPARQLEYFVIYESNLYDSVPSFITTDSVLHSYHLVYGNMMKDIEKAYLFDICKKMTADLLARSIDQYNVCKNSAWSESAKRNVAFAAVSAKLLDDKVKVPVFVTSSVSKELTLISKHAGIADSPILGLKEDYTQYIPRSHYAQNPKLEQYFRALTWLGRASFGLNDDISAKSAVLLTLAISDTPIYSRYTVIDDIVKFWVGESDNITYYDIHKLLIETYGTNPKLDILTNSNDKYLVLSAKFKTLKPPKINGLVANASSSKTARDQQNVAFRVLGQRYTIDADIMQRLVYSEVQANPDGLHRMLPSGLDVAAVLGSTNANRILETRGDTKFANYPENQSRLKSQITHLDTQFWTKNLYNGWLFSINQLLEPPDAKYPMFMQTTEWDLKELNTYMCSWAELKHDTQLYAKPVAAEAGYDERVDTRGYVEPNPILYSRLLYLVNQTEAGLKQRKIITKKTSTVLDLLRQSLVSLDLISKKELKGEDLTAEEHDTIKFFGGVLANIWIKSMDADEYANVIDLNKNNAATIADIANTPDGQTLQVGNGLLDLILVVVPVEGSLRIAVGGVGSYYEFTQPSSERLTDQAWRKLIFAGKEPKRPSWVNPIMDTNIRIKRSSNDNFEGTGTTFDPPDIYAENYGQ